MLTATTPPFPSLKWWWAIRDHEDLSPSLRFVAMVIGSFADERGEVRPSLDRLKADTGLSHAQLKRLRGQLVKLGYLVPVKVGKGRGQASIYRLSFPTENRLIEPSLKQLITPQENGSSDEPLRETVSDTSTLKRGEKYLHQEAELLVAPGSPYGEVVEFPTTSVDPTVTTENHPVATRDHEKPRLPWAVDAVEPTRSAAPPTRDIPGPMGSFGARASDLRSEFLYGFGSGGLQRRLEAYAELQAILGDWRAA